MRLESEEFVVESGGGWLMGRGSLFMSFWLFRYGTLMFVSTEN
jgi:hypothetical protein